MVLDFAPEIGEFKLVGGQARLIKQVTLKGPKNLGGVKYSGRPPHDTSETIDDVAATNATLTDGAVTPAPVAKDPNGYDPEGLVALPCRRSCRNWADGRYRRNAAHSPLTRLTSAGGRPR